MGTEAILALAFGVALGTFLTAATLWLHERKERRALAEIGVRVRRSEAQLQAMLRDSHDILAVIDAEGHLAYANPAAERLFGRRIEPLLGSSPFDFVHPEDLEHVIEVFGNAVHRPGETERVEVRVQHQNGQWRTLEAIGTNLLSDPAVNGMVVSARDVTESRAIHAQLRDAQERFRSAFDWAPIGMALTSLDGRFFRVNRALAQMLGRTEDQLQKATVLAITHEEDRDASTEAMRRAVSDNQSGYRMEKRYLHADGRPVWVKLSVSLVRDPDGAPLYFVSQMEDITERRASGELLAHQAIHDPLTGLPNRLLFVDRLRRALAESNDEQRIAVLFLDLDHFKMVNDSLGHPAGDRLLVALADRVRAAIRPSDVVARFGGDEFTVLCRDVPDEQAARLVASRISSAVALPIALAEGEVFVTASIGIALSGGELETPETLLRNADAAMYRAKDQGRAQAEVYESEAHDRAVRHLRTGNELHRALERGELRMHYQPIIRLEDGNVTGFEALLRWEHPERGLVRPDEFVGLAEETGLVVPIGSWALEESCRQARRWHDAGADVSMSVNLSPRQLAEPGLVDDVARVLRETGVSPDKVWLEITENTLMRDAESMARSLGSLRSLGVHLAVDDFGTGYSSMTYLKRFPVDALKVDRSFVDGLGRDPEDTAICTAVVSLAHALGLRAVAEGVETPEQLAELRTLGCEMAQGYLFGKPQPAEAHGMRPDQHRWAAFGADAVTA
jgi:diguanylate cyclase (GGDEF)-like protein/PAS domain S-box-containing protein